ncbi:hypothetical protein [Sphingomonas sp. LM7]|uniref:hypothetical protein n=1 Tax=Sphingomonas sp. LM7 TaxID=1938607 RepID=UPI00098400DE|nr:hypothetical protein [Sphingomonas sp. LM7]AQR74035.1 hypothetical protein BXU08_10585 [Sphingomonas sp. LM7]
MLALIGTTTSVRACADGAATRYYFFDDRPPARAGRDVLLVRIIAIEGNVVRARLDERFAHALGVAAVMIDLPEYPWGTNCIDYGRRSGTAFVIADRVVRAESGEVRVVAAAVQGPFNTRPRRSRAELDDFIVDPAVKEAAAADSGPR